MLLDTLAPVADSVFLSDVETGGTVVPDARAVGVDVVLSSDTDADDQSLDVLEWRLDCAAGKTAFELAEVRPVAGGLRARFLRRSLHRRISDEDICTLVMRVGRIRPWVGMTKLTGLPAQVSRC